MSDNLPTYKPSYGQARAFLPNCIGVWGPGGTGKTTLTLQVKMKMKKVIKDSNKISFWYTDEKTGTYTMYSEDTEGKKASALIPTSQTPFPFKQYTVRQYFKPDITVKNIISVDGLDALIRYNKYMSKKAKAALAFSLDAKDESHSLPYPEDIEKVASTVILHSRPENKIDTIDTAGQDEVGGRDLTYGKGMILDLPFAMLAMVDNATLNGTVVGDLNGKQTTFNVSLTEYVDRILEIKSKQVSLDFKLDDPNLKPRAVPISIAVNKFDKIVNLEQFVNLFDSECGSILDLLTEKYAKTQVVFAEPLVMSLASAVFNPGSDLFSDCENYKRLMNGRLIMGSKGLEEISDVLSNTNTFGLVAASLRYKTL